MPKVVMTKELGLKLKELRLKYNVKSKDVAEYIGKTAAYYSKLEKANIQTIEESSLEKIVNFITDSETGYEDFMEKISSELSSEKLSTDLWLMNFDNVGRKLPVPESLIEEIKEMMSDLNISNKDLVDYINTNEDLDESFFSEHGYSRESIDYNKWYPYRIKIGDEVKSSAFILVNIKYKNFMNLINQIDDTSNWLTLYTILYHLLKYRFKLINNVDYDKESLKKEANNILNKHKFYSLADKANLSEQAKTQEEYTSLLSEFDKANLQYINKILSAISFLSDYDVKYTNELLKVIANNLDANPSFALRFMATDIATISDFSTKAKQHYLNQVKELTKAIKEDESNQIAIFD